MKNIMLVRYGCESDSDAEDLEHAEKLRQVKAVLEEVYLLLLNPLSSNIITMCFNDHNYMNAYLFNLSSVGGMLPPITFAPYVSLVYNMSSGHYFS